MRFSRVSRSSWVPWSKRLKKKLLFLLKHTMPTIIQSVEQKPKVERRNLSKIPILSTCEAMSHFLLQELPLWFLWQELPLSSILVSISSISKFKSWIGVHSDDAINLDATASAFRRARRLRWYSRFLVQALLQFGCISLSFETSQMTMLVLTIFSPSLL